MKTKIISFEKAVELISQYKLQNKKVVLCNGCFDLVHIGHIEHLQQSKKLGDILFVMITADKYIKKGINRPLFTEDLRLKNIEALECVDYVFLNIFENTVDALNILKSDIYSKGSDFGSVENDYTGALKKEQKVIEDNNGKIVFTKGVVHSSSNLINKIFDIINPNIRAYISQCKQRFSIQNIVSAVEKLNDLKILIIGETIIDKYSFCELLQRASKSYIISTKEVKDEIHLGGALCIARHLSDFCNHIDIYTTISESDINFVNSQLPSNVTLLPIRVNETIVKHRFLEVTFLNKLFETSKFFNTVYDNVLSESFLNKIKENYDLIILADFGHGLISPEKIDKLTSLNKFIAVTAQTNSANYGFNTICKYRHANYIVIDHEELQLACGIKSTDLSFLLNKLNETNVFNNITITKGHNGISFYNGRVYNSPALGNDIVDTTGAGDAVLAITSPLFYLNTNPELSIFIGACMGALAIKYLGNKRAISKYDLLTYATALLK